MTSMMRSYLDYNAASPVREEVKSALSEGFEIFGNPASVHTIGRVAKMKLEKAREKIADYLQISSRRILFTGSATEANNTVLRAGFEKIITSEAEHDSVYKTAERLTADKMATLEICPVERDLSVRQSALELIMRLDPDLKQKSIVSFEVTRHDNGLIQPLRSVYKIVRQDCAEKNRGIFLHADAVQAFGKIPPSDYIPHADFITLSAHKIGGLRGCAVLIIPDHFEFPALLTGGGQEHSRRAGTENLIAILAFAKMIEVIEKPEYAQEELTRIKRLRDQTEITVKKINPNAIITAENAERVGNVMQIITPGVASATQVMIADLEGVCVSAGSACSSGNVKTGRALKAAGFSDADANCGLRVSFGHASTTEDQSRFLNAYQKIAAVRK